MTISHLSTREVAQRWNISLRTLDRWRWAGEGPRFLKLGGRVVYRLADIEAFEEANLHTRTDLPANAPGGTPPAPVAHSAASSRGKNRGLGRYITR
jgi:predicted DNA-binding transcriptional regulator AlpA